MTSAAHISRKGLRRIQQSLADRTGIVADMRSGEREDAPAGVDQLIRTRIVGRPIQKDGEAQGRARKVGLRAARSISVRKSVRTKPVVQKHVGQHSARQGVVGGHGSYVAWAECLASAAPLTRCCAPTSPARGEVTFKKGEVSFLSLSPCGRGRGPRASARGRVRGSAYELLPDAFEHALDVAQDIRVPETDDFIPGALKRCSAQGISLGRVLPAVGFDDQPRLEADEVGDVTVDGHLPAKLRIGKLAGTQMPPQQLFGIRGIAAEVFGAAGRHRHNCNLPAYRRRPLTLPSPLATGPSLSHKGRGYESAL